MCQNCLLIRMKGRRHGKVIVVLLAWLSPVIECILIELSYDAR